MKWYSPLAFLLLALAGAVPPNEARANDSAAAIAAGGVVLREEKRVAMLKERLLIRHLGADRSGRSRFRVEVDYEFLNESPTDVVTEVAFPVPEYSYQYERASGPVDLGAFHAWVDGKRIEVAKDVRANLHGRDYSSLLRGMGVDPERHGNFSPDPAHAAPDQLRDLVAADVDRLVREGLVRGAPADERWPTWGVAITWHWQQVFPAGRVVHVRHEYTPAAGHAYASDAVDLLQGLPRLCADEALAARLNSRQAALSTSTARHGAAPLVWASWVEYVLKTARSWKMPIREFELVIERPKGAMVTLCWPGPVTKVGVGTTSFSARLKDFVPQDDLTVYFLEVR